MEQLRLTYFWPLTEQIPLDLDYSECARPKFSGSASEFGATTIRCNDLTNYSITAANLNIDVDSTVIKVKETPNLVRRGLYKAMGLKWQLK